MIVNSEDQNGVVHIIGYVELPTLLIHRHVNRPVQPGLGTFDGSQRGDVPLRVPTIYGNRRRVEVAGTKEKLSRRSVRIRVLTVARLQLAAAALPITSIAMVAHKQQIVLAIDRKTVRVFQSRIVSENLP